MRKITQYTSKDMRKHAAVFYNSEYQEYVVRFYEGHPENWTYLSNADYHTDDKQGAKDTMKHWVDN